MTATALRVVRDQPELDLERARLAVADLLSALGKDAASPHLSETPRRVADAYVELLTPRGFDLTSFPNEEGYDELVLARDIPVHSLCEHHLLPFQVSPTSATSPVSGFSGCPSSPGSWSCTRVTSRCRSG